MNKSIISLSPQPQVEDVGRTPPANTRIIVIDDNASVLDTFRKVLNGRHQGELSALEALESSLFADNNEASAEQSPFDLELVQDGQTGCERVRSACNEGRPFAVAFVDVRMPGGWDGLKTVEELWHIDASLQVVICTAYSDYSWQQIANRLKCSDRLLILRKPFEAIEVLQLASALSEKWRLYRERQAQLAELEEKVAERTQHLEQALNKNRAYESKLQHQAFHDALTGLPNRNALDESLAFTLGKFGNRRSRLAVIFIDVDRFKFINDSYGHAMGDAVLKTIAARLTVVLRSTDTVAHLGGDEFAVLIPHYKTPEDVATIAQKLLDAIAAPIDTKNYEIPKGFRVHNDQDLRVTASIGLALCPEDGVDGSSLLSHADTAMYLAKATGGNSYRYYAQEMGIRIRERTTLESALRCALEKNQFELHYQPKASLKNGQLYGFEALLRWRHPELGMVPPDHFIPLAEETGMIVQIGEWVLQTASKQLKEWHDAGFGGLSMAVNLSVRQFQQMDIPSLVQRILAAIGLSPEYLILELTESLLMSNSESIACALDELKALGAKLSLDDFGTGYSSLSYLKRYPIDEVKIDRSFIDDVTLCPHDASITKAILAMARSLNMHTVAEGVETEGQLAFVRENGCDAIQGYFFSRPQAAGDIGELLQAGKSLEARLDIESNIPVVLLVDDEVSILNALKRQLRGNHYQIMTTTSPREALELLALHPVKVIVSDVRMPEMSGIELLRRVKELHPKVSRIILSGYTELDSVAAAINEVAVFKFLTKPWDDRLLNKQIESALEQASS